MYLWLREELKMSMKTYTYSEEFELDIAHFFGLHPDGNAVMEALFQSLGDYTSGLSSRRLQVDVLTEDTRLIRFMTVQANLLILVLVPFRESAETRDLLRAQVFEVPMTIAA